MSEQYIQLPILENKIKDIFNTICFNHLIVDDKRFDILGGKAGEILFKISFHEYFKSDYEELYVDIELLIERMSNTDYVCGGISGLAGVLFTLFIVKEKYPDFDEINEFLEQLEELVINSFYEFVQVKNFDYLHGATGIIVVFLCNSEKYLKHIEYYIDKLYIEYSDENNIEKFSKFNDNTFLFEFKNDFSNSSFAHGISGLLVTLSKIHKLNLYNSSINKVSKNLTDLLSKFKTVDCNSSFTNYLPNKNNSTRMGWCVGDLGISLAYWEMGSMLEDEKYKMNAIDLFNKCSERKDLKKNLVFDAGFCHGTSGIAQIFNKIFMITGDEKYKEVAYYWLNQTFIESNQDNGYAGFKAWQADFGWQNEYGLLEGISGIGLVLLDFLKSNNENSILNRSFL